MLPIKTFLIRLRDQIRNRIPSQKTLRSKAFRRKALRTAIIVCGTGILFAIILFAWYYKDLPRPGELRTRSASESTILYDRTGKQIYDISGEERRILIKNDEIPTTIKQATVSIEDHNFYKHAGLDFRGLIRGTILKPLSGSRAQGGSTITQQYVKNALLSPHRSVIRKIKELILSLEIEAVYSKDEILTLYLNEIPYGSNLYGVEAASQAYYGKSAKDGLTIAQAATLAAIPQAPTYYSPYGTHVEQLMKRKNLVIDAMVKNGSITKEEGEKAKTEAPLASKDFAQKRENFPAPHFVMYVREQLVQKYGEQAVQRGGLRVTTTLDLDMQKIADDTVKEKAGVLKGVKASNASLVAMDPKTGQVLAMVGSLDYFDRENEGNFNVATSPSRQPGSAGKPIVYATLFKERWSPGSPLWDVATDFNGYKPQNFDGKFHGPLSIRTALGNSYNIPAVKALQLAGINNFLSTARDLGITTLDDQKDAGLSLALGGGSVKLIDLTSAYGVLANHGDRNPTTTILKVQDSRGKVLDEWKQDSKQVLAPEIAYEISSMLSDPEAKKPTFTRLLGVLTVPGKSVASKTGTTNSYKDAWTLGYTPSLVAGVWAGNNNGDEMDHGGGSTAAAPIWQAFMAKALAGKDNEPFFRPDSIQDYEIDFLSGRRPTEASGQRNRDLFAAWQIPNKDDDVHKLVKVCKSNGLLATDATPPDEIESKIFTQVRSERPDNPAWEGPVQAWANEKGINSPIPTQKCDISFTSPRVSITTPSNGDTISGIFSVAADVTFPPNTDGSVEFFLDDGAVTTDTEAPYAATFDTTNASAGSHSITARAKSSNGNSSSDSINVTFAADNSSPSDVIGATVTPGVGGTATASWKNPSDSDLAAVWFYASQASGVKGAKIASVSASPNTNQSTVLKGLASGTANYITIVTVDTKGNTNPTTSQYTVVPL